ncbi:MAG TPA: hypothetical protein VII06_17420 [Chloroflexota bacterium]|jgi:hypothetical protein
MADTPRPVEINGLVFASTSEGHLLESEVRRHVEALQQQVGELRSRLEHLDSLERLAQSTVMKADELAAEIETEARGRVDEMTLACETEITERRRAFEAEAAAQQAAAQARVTQLQSALEGTIQTLGRALQAAGAPALEMPPASASSWSPPSTATASPVAEGNGQLDSSAAAVSSAVESSRVEAAEPGPNTHFGADLAPPAEDEAPSWRGTDEAAPEVVAVEAAEPSDGPADERALAEADSAVQARDAQAKDALGEPWQSTAVDAEPAEAVAESGVPRSQTFELSRRGRSLGEPTPIRPSLADQADEERAGPVDAPAESAPTTLSRTGPMTIEIDMRPVKSFADLARVTKLLGRIAPGAQPVDLNLPQHRALFSVRGKDVEALATQLQEALPEAKVVEREAGLDVLLEGE